MARNQMINGQWLHRYHQNMGAIRSSHCARCVRIAQWKLLHQNRRFKHEMLPSLQPHPVDVKVIGHVSAGSETTPAPSKTVKKAVSQRAASAPTPALEPVASPKKRKLSEGDVSAVGSKEKKVKVNGVGPEKAQVAKKQAGESEPPKEKGLKAAEKKAFEKQKTGPQKKTLQQDHPATKKRSLSEPSRPSKPSDVSSKPSDVSSKPSDVSSKPSAASSKPSAASKATRAWPSTIGTPQVKGLWNPHSYCYRRSALQSLLCTPHFTNLLALHPRCQKPCVVCALRALSTATHTPSGPKSLTKPIQSLDAIIKATSRTSSGGGRNSTAPRWTSNGPQDDAFLFLAYLLETLEHAPGIPKQLFNATYTVKHRTSWTCAECKKIHVNDHANPPSTSLQVPLAGRSLASCLDAHHRETGTTITCDRAEGGCGNKAERTRIVSIKSAPEILTVQIKRFGFAYRRGRKNAAFVDVPEMLDLSRWACEGVAGKEGGMRYKLQAVVLHGGELGGGHYIAYVKTPGGGGKTGPGGAGGWLHVSDESVSRGGTEALHVKETYCPYILTYVKVED